MRARRKLSRASFFHFGHFFDGVATHCWYLSLSSAFGHFSPKIRRKEFAGYPSYLQEMYLTGSARQIERSIAAKLYSCPERISRKATQRPSLSTEAFTVSFSLAIPTFSVPNYILKTAE